MLVVRLQRLGRERLECIGELFACRIEHGELFGSSGLIALEGRLQRRILCRELEDPRLQLRELCSLFRRDFLARDE